MAEQESVYLWSTTALTNGSSDPAINYAEGQLPGTVNNSNRAQMAAIARFIKDTDGSLTTAGSANAYTLTINGRQTPLATGHRLSFKASFANTAAATLAVTNADAVVLGTKAIRGPGDVALTTGQIVSGGRYDVVYDTAANSAAGAWMLMSVAVPVDVLSLNGLTGALKFPLTPGLKLTLTTGVATTEADVTGATSIFATPASHDYVEIYDATNWVPYQCVELTLALDSNSGHTGYHQSGKNFFLGVINDSGTRRLASSVAWSGDTTIGTGAGTAETEIFEGRLVNKVAMTVRFGSVSGNTVSVAARQMTIIGGFRASADGQTEDSFAKRFLSNIFLTSRRPMKATETTDTWTYSTSSFRQANGASANRLQYFSAAAGMEVHAIAAGAAITSTATARTVATGIGIDSTTVNSASFNVGLNTINTIFAAMTAVYNGYPGIGYHAVNWLEFGGGTDTQTWLGDGGSTAFNYGISGYVDG